MTSVNIPLTQNMLLLSRREVLQVVSVITDQNRNSRYAMRLHVGTNDIRSSFEVAKLSEMTAGTNI